MVKKVIHSHSIPTKEEFDILCRTMTQSNMYPLTNRGLFLRWRDLTILKLLFYLGGRTAEILNLRWKDIDFNKMTVKFLPYFNKVKIERPAQLCGPAKEALLDFHEICRDMGVSFEFIFPSCETFQPIQTDRFCKVFKNYAREAGLLKVEWITDAGRKQYNLTPYSGRRWFGTEVFRKTHSDLAVQFLMRHKKLRSAEPYIAPSSEDLHKITNVVFR